MTNQEALEKAIQIATDNGWTMFSLIDEWGKQWFVREDDYLEEPYLGIGRVRDYYRFSLQTVIYNHDFAKALWGDRECNCTPTKLSLSVLHQRGCPAGQHFEAGYKYHLQQMVIAPDPIKYLADNLPE